MKRLLPILTILIACAVGTAVAQEAWPQGDVTFVTHSSPGGGSDVLARAIARALQDLTGVSVTVENHTGGSGAIALLYMASGAERDGHTLMTVTPTQVITPLNSPEVPNYQQMTPVARLFMDPAMLYVRGDSQFETAEDLIDHARENPGSQTWGIGSAGSLDQLVIEQTETATGADVRIVPHEGGGDALTSVLGGHVDAALGEPAELVTQIESGNIRVLAIYQEERLENFPDVPTFLELGYEVTSTKFRGVWGPPGLDDDMVAAIAARLNELYESEVFRAYYEPGSLQPAFLAGQDFVDFLDANNDGIAEFLRAR